MSLWSFVWHKGVRNKFLLNRGPEENIVLITEVSFSKEQFTENTGSVKKWPWEKIIVALSWLYSREVNFNFNDAKILLMNLEAIQNDARRFQIGLLLIFMILKIFKHPTRDLLYLF